MNPKTKSLSLNAILSAALFLTLSASQAGVETTQAPNGTTVTKITVNGLFASVILVDAGSEINGGLTASKDQVANTSALDFSYAFPDHTRENTVIIIQGGGQIPNSAFTVTSDSAHLAVTTPFPVNRCAINSVTGDGVCDFRTPITFDLTWTANGFSTVDEKTNRTETIGPLVTKLDGEFHSLLSKVHGTWGGHTSADNTGERLDTKSRTVLREITQAPHP